MTETMKKKIWIWNHYATNTFFDRAGRHYWMAEYLKKNGFDVRVFCANTVHNSQKTVCVTSGKWMEDIVDDIPYIFIKTPGYVGNGKDRVMNILGFYRGILSASKEYIAIDGEPDLIISSSVHPLTCVAGIRKAKRLNISCICEIRDLWPESIVAYSRYNRDDLMMRMLYKMEKWIYKRAQDIVFTFPGGYDYILDQNWEDIISENKVHYINTGADSELFEKKCSESVLHDEDMDNDECYKIVYTGSIRKVNNLRALIDAAVYFQKNDPSIRFILFGDGDERPLLEDFVNRKKLNNVLFKGYVERKYIPGILRRADLLFVSGQKTEITRYGESWNKLFDYMLSGHPIISTMPSRIIQDERIGMDDLDNTDKIVAAIEHYRQISGEELQSMEQRITEAGRRYDYNKLMKNILPIIEKNL